MPQKYRIPLLSLLLLLVTSCEWKEPVLPMFNLKLGVPFAVEKFVLGKEIKTSSNITISASGPDSLLLVSIVGTLDPQEIAPDDFKLAPLDSNTTLSLDTLRLNSLATLRLTTITLGQVWPQLNQLIGSTIDIPDTTIGNLSGLLESEEFRSISFLGGDIRVRISNGLPFAIGPNSSSNGFQMTIASDSLPNGDNVQVLFPEPILPGQSAEKVENISGKILYEPLRLSYNFPIVGQAGVLVTRQLLDSVGVAVEVELDNITANEVVARLEPQILDDTLQVAYEAETRLREALINRGAIRLEFTSFLPLAAALAYEIPAIRTPQGLPYTGSISLDSNGSGSQLIQLNGLLARNPDNPGELIDSLRVIVTGQTLEPGGLVHVSNRDSIIVNVSSDTIFFDSFSGFIAEDSLDIDPFSEGDLVDYEDFSEGGITLSTAELVLKIRTDIGVENLSADIDVRGYHTDANGMAGDSARILIIDEPFNGGTPGGGFGETELRVSGQRVADFINILPDSIRISGQVKVAGNVSVAVGNIVEVSYSLETPVKVSVNGLAAFESQIDSITSRDLPDDLQNAADDDLTAAELELVVRNRTPIAGTMRLVITTDPNDVDLFDNIIDTSLAIQRDIAITPAPVNPATGLSSGVSTSTISLALNRREIRLFSRPPLYLAYQARLNDTNGFVTLRYSDYVEALGAARFVLLVKE